MRGLDNLNKRMQFLGQTSDDRNVKGKLSSFHSALNNSYQAEMITLDKEKGYPKKSYRVLINPDKLKDDYDKKYISADFFVGLKEGDTFCWKRTDSHWMVMAQLHEEEAYFRAQITRCDTCITINNHHYWIYLRGPVETTTQWRQKHQVEFNDLNYSLLMYIQKNEETLEYFTRHRQVEFNNHNWKVAATDKYGQDGYIQVYLDEDHDNPIAKEQIIPEEVVFDKKDIHIDGPQKVYVYDEKLKYEIKNISGGAFVVNSNLVEIVDSSDCLCELNVLTGKKGKFILSYEVDGVEETSLEVLIDSF